MALKANWPELGRAIWKAREKVGMPRAKLARAIDMDPAQLLRIERGEIGLRAPQLRAIADILGVSLDDLVPPLSGEPPAAA
jgi:transcriptional regulator with XRE-family HTH domain